MTKEEAYQYMADHAEKSFFGTVHKFGDRANKYSVYFWSQEKDCMDLYVAIGKGGLRPQPGVVPDRTHLFFVNDQQAKEVTKELEPYYVKGGPEARRRLRYMLW